MDVTSLISQLERSEQARLATEAKMVTLKNDNQKLQEKYDRANNSIKRLNSDVKDHRERLRITEDTLERMSVRLKVFFLKTLS